MKTIPKMKSFKQVVNEILLEDFSLLISEDDFSKTFEEIGLNILDRVELMMKIEHEFQCSIPDLVCEHCNTINDIGRYFINKRIATY